MSLEEKADIISKAINEFLEKRRITNKKFTAYTPKDRSKIRTIAGKYNIPEKIIKRILFH